MNLEKKLQNLVGNFTASERKVATALLADYPFAGLLTVVELAKRAKVSAQTILRLTSKLGFHGYAEFQRALIGEIKEGYHSPVILHETLKKSGKGGSALADLADSAIGALKETVNSIPESPFDNVCQLVSDRSRSIYLIGGRMTDTIATYLFLHLRQIRPKVYKIPTHPEEWPEYVLRMSKKDVVIFLDYRRYQPDLETLAAQTSRERGAQNILITDKWLSPVSKHSVEILPAATDIDTPWDTGITAMLIVEAIINSVSDKDWTTTRKRIEKWDALRLSSSKQLDKS